MRAKEKEKANKRVCYPEMLASSHGFGCGIPLKASDGKPRDYPASGRSHTWISCHTHTMENGREICKLCFLRIGPGGEITWARAPAALLGASRQLMPPQARQGPVARSLEAESWGVSPWCPSGAGRLAGYVSLPRQVLLGSQL